jgi:hypothetical protein
MAANFINPITQPQQPVVDTQNPIGSLATLLGPTPAEREAMERKALKNKSKMQAWAGLFDGLRQLGNLYAVSKGAKPQQFTDNPYQQLEANYQADRQRAYDLENYRRQYAQQLYNIQRQGADEMRRNALAQAQVKHYGNMDEVARQKAEIDKLKAARVIKMKDGSLQKYDPITGTVDELREGDPLYEEYMRSQINRNNRANTGNSRSSKNPNTYEYTTEQEKWTDENGRQHTRTVRKDPNRHTETQTEKVTEKKKETPKNTPKPQQSNNNNSDSKKKRKSRTSL